MSSDESSKLIPSSASLRLAEPHEIKDALSYALRFDLRRRVHDADARMADIAAERLVEHLRRSGFVVLKKPPAPAH